MAATIKLHRINSEIIQICLQKDDEDFFSVLAEVNSDNFCDEHNLDLKDVAIQIGTAISYTSLVEDYD